MSASRMDIARSWAVEWRGGDGLDVVEPQHRQKNKKIANSQLEFDRSMSCALGCTTTDESDGNEGR